MLYIFVSNISFFVAWNDFCRNSPYTICSEVLEKRHQLHLIYYKGYGWSFAIVNSAHDVMKGNVFRIAGFLWGESIGIHWIPYHRRPLIQTFDAISVVIFGLNKLLNQALSCLWFEISWCLCDLTVMFIVKNQYVRYIPIDQADKCTTCNLNLTTSIIWFIRVAMIPWHIYDGLFARSMYLGHGWIITLYSVL